MGSTVVDWLPRKAVWLHWQHSQSMRLVQTANRGLLNMWPANCWASVAKSWSPHMSYGVFSLFLLAEPSLTLARLILNRRPTCQYGTMWRVYRGCSRDAIFASSSKFFLVFTLLRTIFNYLILCRGLGLRFWVMFKTGTITPNRSVQMLWASLSETTDQYI